MTAVYRTTRRVEFRDTDAAGIAHFSAFVLWMEQVEHEFLRSRGLSVVSADDQGTISWPRVSVQCDFQAAARFEELLDVELRVERLGEKSVTYGFQFGRGGVALAQGRLVAVCCRLHDGAPPQGIAIPPAFRAALAGEAP